MEAESTPARPRGPPATTSPRRASPARSGSPRRLDLSQWVVSSTKFGKLPQFGETPRDSLLLGLTPICALLSELHLPSVALFFEIPLVFLQNRPFRFRVFQLALHLGELAEIVTSTAQRADVDVRTHCLCGKVLAVEFQ